MRVDEDHPAAVPRGAWIGSASRQAELPGPLRELHRAVLRRFLQTGGPPAAGWVAGAAAGLYGLMSQWHTAPGSFSLEAAMAALAGTDEAGP